MVRNRDPMMRFSFLPLNACGGYPMCFHGRFWGFFPLSILTVKSLGLEGGKNKGCKVSRFLNSGWESGRELWSASKLIWDILDLLSLKYQEKKFMILLLYFVCFYYYYPQLFQNFKLEDNIYLKIFEFMSLYYRNNNNVNWIKI